MRVEMQKIKDLLVLKKKRFKGRKKVSKKSFLIKKKFLGKRKNFRDLTFWLNVKNLNFEPFRY